jgi:hypothetical protein
MGRAAVSVHVDVPSLKQPEQYRRLAREAIQRAEGAPSAYFRLSYLSLAAGWRALASEAEKAYDGCTHTEISALREIWPEQRPE